MSRHLHRSSHTQATVTAVAALVALASVMSTHGFADTEEAAEALIRRVVAQTTRAGIAARSVRDLRAGTVTGKHQASMKVATSIAPSGAFSWNVIQEEGSERTREKVLRAVLEGEAESWRAGARDNAAVSRANYTFIPGEPDQSGHLRIQLQPKRSDSKLVDGVLTVDQDGYPISLQGRLAKSPSFWVRSVTVIKHYGRFAGVALPVSIESLADVKMVGKSSFSMRYQYQEVNGRPVSQSAAATPQFGPSREILAAFETNRNQN
jgi:hypothetical protein